MQAVFDMRALKNEAAKLIGFKAVPRWALADPDEPGKAPKVLEGTDNEICVSSQVPAETEKTVWIYLDKTPAPEGSSAGAKEKWMKSEQNLLFTRNGSAEEASQDGKPLGWEAAEEGKPNSKSYSSSRAKGGVDGEWCLETSVPKSVAAPGWVGWRQKVSVKPNCRYAVSPATSGPRTSTAKSTSTVTSSTRAAKSSRCSAATSPERSTANGCATSLPPWPPPEAPSSKCT